MIDPMGAFDIAASGMAAQRIQMDVIAQNLANANVERTDGVPFRARSAVFEVATEPDSPSGGAFDIAFDDESGLPAGVRFAGLVEQPPQAYAGHVGTDSVDPISQMIGLVAAGRAYDADVSALQAAKQMDVEAADITQL
jgi:flagellar basal-body rod protein FlgC